MILIITHPEPLPNETSLWRELLAAGADALLLRRPQWGADDYEQVLTQMDPACYNRMLIAGHWQLWQRFGLMGVHLSESLRNKTLLSTDMSENLRNKALLSADNSESLQSNALLSTDNSQYITVPTHNTPTPPTLLEDLRRQGCRLSTGIHSTADLPRSGAPWDLLLLSPVFDSISKPGYKGRFHSGFRLPHHGSEAKVLALGGVDETNAAQARQMGFDGIGLLGAIWQKPAQAVEQFHAISQQWNTNAHM